VPVDSFGRCTKAWKELLAEIERLGASATPTPGVRRAGAPSLRPGDDLVAHADELPPAQDEQADPVRPVEDRGPGRPRERIAREIVHDEMRRAARRRERGDVGSVGTEPDAGRVESPVLRALLARDDEPRRAAPRWPTWTSRLPSGLKRRLSGGMASYGAPTASSRTATHFPPRMAVKARCFPSALHRIAPIFENGLPAAPSTTTAHVWSVADRNSRRTEQARRFPSGEKAICETRWKGSPTVPSTTTAGPRA